MIQEGNTWTTTKFSNTQKDNSEIKKKLEVEVAKKARFKDNSIGAKVHLESDVIRTTKKNIIVLDIEEASVSIESKNHNDEVKLLKFATIDNKDEAFCNTMPLLERKEELPSPERKEELLKSLPV